MLKVLIAEDDLMIADMVEETLMEHGYDVCGIGRNVADSLVLASRHKPDLAILDVRLADGDMGTQIAAELSDIRKLGILYVTANVAAVERTAVHGHACLEKPYRSGDLLRSLEIVAEMIDNGTASPPFPANFRVLPEGVMPSMQDSDGHLVRVRTLRRQQSVTATFGSYVLREADLSAVLTEAVRACADGLSAPFCKVYRYRPEQDDLIREAGFGGHAGMNEHIVLRPDASTPEGRVFVTREPVICNALLESTGSNRQDSRVASPVVSTVDVVIMSDDGKPYGVLGASNGAQQAYDQNDVRFLSGIGNILAGAIANFERTKMLNEMIERLQSATGKSNQLPGPARVAGDMPRPPGMSNGRSWRVLIVEDDTVFRDILMEQFAAEGGFTVVTAGTLAEADQALAEDSGHFDTILLDVKVPDGDGCEYCAKLRQLKYGMPIIMLTGANEEEDVVRGLDSGADDYISKPFKWMELLARLRVQRRLFDGREEAVFTIGPYLFSPAKKLLEDKLGNRRVRLTSMECAVLKYLYHHQGHTVVTRQILAKEVWGYNSQVKTHTLETHMYRLRQKIEANPGAPTILLTEAGGYKLNTN
jgi:DNA-binding response OmpR family regulator